MPIVNYNVKNTLIFVKLSKITVAFVLLGSFAMRFDPFFARLHQVGA